MASQSLDDMIAALMSMGFELQDAQDAVQYGKISTQEAVEWLLAGKPGYASRGSAAPTLKLGNQTRRFPDLEPDTQAPFSSPLPIPDGLASSGAAGQSSSVPSASTAEPTSDLDMEQQVVSRLHLTEEKIAHQKSFEEKERAEAHRQAKLDKIQAKREHERVLKEIAEDRKVNKMMRMHGPATPAAASSDAASSTHSVAKASEATSSSSTSAMCSLQIRLPNGQQLRKKLDRNTTLGQLWKDILGEAEDQTNGYSGFMQPFPRREFSASEMNKTLEQLGLVPSGSLVLKKEEAGEVLAAPQAEPAEAEEEEGEDVDADSLQSQMHMWGRGRTLDDPGPSGQEAGAEPVLPREDMREEEVGGVWHRVWGRGHRLEGEDVVMDADDNNDNIDDEDNGHWDGPQGFQGFGGQGLGGLGGGGGGPGAMLGWFGQQGFQPGVFMGAGQRLVPAGAPGADDHNNRPVGDLAAEAAQQRLAHPPPQPPAPAREPSPPLAQVKPLQESCFVLVVNRIKDPVNPIRSLGPMPQDLAQRFISYLLRNKLLDTRTMQLFVSCFLQRLVLDTYTYTTNELLYALRIHHSLQTLSLHSCPLINDQGIKHIASLKNLRVLNLGLCKQLTNNSLKVIAGFPQLHTLSLEETGVTDQGLVQYFATKPCLKNLNLNRTSVTNDIFTHLQNLKELQVLYLEETKITSLQGVEELKQLVVLNVASTHITTDTLLYLVDHPSLTQLSFTNTDNIVGDTALQYLAGLKLRTLYLPDRHSVTSAGLAHITGFVLHTLDLTNYIHVGDKGMEHVGKITSLRQLMLSNTKVTDEGLLQLSELVRLKILYLDRTTVSDAGIMVVKAFKQLSELSLSTTSVTSHFLKEGVLHSCQGLTKLNLSRTNVGDKGVVKLKLPHLMLLNLDCTRVHARVVDIIKANCPSLKSVTTANLTPVFEEEEGEEEEEEA